MAPVLTPEDVVRRIAAECVFVDERGAVGIRLKPAAAIVRLYGNQILEHRGRSDGLGHLNRRRCYDWLSVPLPADWQQPSSVYRDRRMDDGWFGTGRWTSVGSLSSRRPS